MQQYNLMLCLESAHAPVICFDMKALDFFYSHTAVNSCMQNIYILTFAWRKRGYGIHWQTLCITVMHSYNNTVCRLCGVLQLRWSKTKLHVRIYRYIYMYYVCSLFSRRAFRPADLCILFYLFVSLGLHHREYGLRLI